MSVGDFLVEVRLHRVGPRRLRLRWPWTYAREDLVLATHVAPLTQERVIFAYHPAPIVLPDGRLYEGFDLRQGIREVDPGW